MKAFVHCASHINKKSETHKASRSYSLINEFLIIQQTLQQQLRKES